MIRKTLLVAAVGMTLPTVAQAASGTVSFGFTTYSGPFNSYFRPTPSDPIVINSDLGGVGYLNDYRIFETGWGGNLAPRDAANQGGWLVGRDWAIPGSPDAVELRYGSTPFGSDGVNIISFTPRPFTNVNQGEDFILGSLTFQNGFWFGGGETGAFNRSSELGFTLSTRSRDGAAFNQTITGTIRMTVHNPGNNNLATLAGQQAEADWVTLYSSAVSLRNPFAAFRVYDLAARPAGFTNRGSVDIVARFNSLDLIEFANPRGGFLTASNDPLPADPIGPPPPPPGVPEPSAWALLIAGFGLVGAAARQRRTLRASN